MIGCFKMNIIKYDNDATLVNNNVEKMKELINVINMKQSYRCLMKDRVHERRR